MRAQAHRVESARATIEQTERRLAQLSANYRAQLRTERVDAEREAARLAEEIVGHPLPGAVKQGGPLKALREKVRAAA